MNAKRWLLALCAVALFNAPRPASAGQLLKAAGRGIPNQYLVVIDPSAVKQVAAASSTNGAAATRQLAMAIAQQANARPAAVYGNVRQFLVNVPESTALRLARDPRVLLVEQDATFTVSAIPSCYSASSFPAANSYDPTSPQTISCWDPQLSCSDNWGLDRIDQRTGSESAHTLDGHYAFTANGQGTHIYLLDTGIATGHTEFALPGGASRIGNGINVGTGAPSWDTWDYLGHGTHVASNRGRPPVRRRQGGHGASGEVHGCERLGHRVVGRQRRQLDHCERAASGCRQHELQLQPGARL